MQVKDENRNKQDKDEYDKEERRTKMNMTKKQDKDEYDKEERMKNMIFEKRSQENKLVCDGFYNNFCPDSKSETVTVYDRIFLDEMAKMHPHRFFRRHGKHLRRFIGTCMYLRTIGIESIHLTTTQWAQLLKQDRRNFHRTKMLAHHYGLILMKKHPGGTTTIILNKELDFYAIKDLLLFVDGTMIESVINESDAPTISRYYIYNKYTKSGGSSFEGLPKKGMKKWTELDASGRERLPSTSGDPHAINLLPYFSHTEIDYLNYLKKDDGSIADRADRGETTSYLDLSWIDDNHQSSFKYQESIKKINPNRFKGKLKNCLPWREYLIESTQ